MIILTSLGANLPQDLADKYGIALVPNSLVIEGKTTRFDQVTHEELEALLKAGRETPHTVSASAADFVTALTPLAKRDKDIIVITGGRKGIGSYDAVNAAVRVLQTQPANKGLNVRIIDTQTHDIGCGMIALRLAMAVKAGASPTDTIDIAHQMISSALGAFVPENMDALKRAGRLAAVKAMAANLLNVVPLVLLTGGDSKPIRMVSVKENAALVIADYLTERIPEGTSVWVGIIHNSAVDRARTLEDRLRTRYKVRFLMNRRATPGVYVLLGRGMVAATVIPIDERFAEP